MGRKANTACVAHFFSLPAEGDTKASSAELLSSAKFSAALRYCLVQGSAEAGPMHLQPSYRWDPGPAPLLRGLLLDCLRPGVDGSLPGYTPSPAFAQTHCKAWQREGPRGRRGALLAAQAAGEPPPDSTGIGQVAWLVLPRLEGEWLAKSAVVCKDWRQLIAEDASCQAGLQAGAKAAEDAAARSTAAWAAQSHLCKFY